MDNGTKLHTEASTTAKQRPSERPKTNATTPAAPPLALSVNQAAATLSISRATLYREIRDGHLRKRTVRGRTLIAFADAQAWLDAAGAKSHA